MKRMEKEAEKPVPDMATAKELMRRTYPKRRRWILEEEQPVSDICDEYPFYKMPNVVSFIMCAK